MREKRKWSLPIHKEKMFLRTLLLSGSQALAKLWPHWPWGPRGLPATGLLLHCWDGEHRALPGRGSGSLRRPAQGALGSPAPVCSQNHRARQPFLQTGTTTGHLRTCRAMTQGSPQARMERKSHKDRNPGLERHPELFSPPLGCTASK